MITHSCDLSHGPSRFTPQEEMAHKVMVNKRLAELKENRMKNKMNLQEAYKVMQAACGIEVGDIWRPVRKFKKTELGSFATCWDADSIKALMQGVACEVEELWPEAVWLKRPGHPSFSFPFFALELVEKAKPEKMIPVYGKEYSEASLDKAMKYYEMSKLWIRRT